MRKYFWFIVMYVAVLTICLAKYISKKNTANFLHLLAGQMGYVQQTKKRRIVLHKTAGNWKYKGERVSDIHN